MSQLKEVFVNFNAEIEKEQDKREKIREIVREIDQLVSQSLKHIFNLRIFKTRSKTVSGRIKNFKVSRRNGT
jgi:hypothetical protein